MPAPIPVPMRERIIALYEQGKKTRHIVAALGYCKSAVRRVRQHHRERGTVEPRRRPPPASGLTPAVAVELQELVAATPDATLHELAADLSTGVSPSTVDRWLGGLGLTLKKSRTGPPSRTGRTWPTPGRLGRPR